MGPGYGYPPQPPGYGPPPPSYLAWAILSTLFCCLPAGIVSIVFAAQVNGKFSAGDYQGALAASRNAKTWATISTVAGVAAIFVVLLLTVVGRQVPSGT
jgi:hypothetical protein